MALIQLGDEWSELMAAYELDHQNPVNRACHAVGIPMILASLPLGASIVGLPLAIPLFTVGWTFQFVGHVFEGKKPSFVEDRRALVVGALWWTKKVGLGLVDAKAKQHTDDSRRGGLTGSAHGRASAAIGPEA